MISLALQNVYSLLLGPLLPFGECQAVLWDGFEPFFNTLYSLLLLGAVRYENTHPIKHTFVTLVLQTYQHVVTEPWQGMHTCEKSWFTVRFRCNLEVSYLCGLIARRIRSNLGVIPQGLHIGLPLLLPTCQCPRPRTVRLDPRSS